MKGSDGESSPALYRYFQTGDLIIGGIVSLNSLSGELNDFRKPYHSSISETV